LLHRIYNLSTHLPNLPDFIYENAAWFFYISNELEMDRIKAETAARAAITARANAANDSARNSMRRRMTLG